MTNRVQKKHLAPSENDGMSHPFRESSRHSDKLERRSCRGCYQRKVRCDRKAPCTNCSKCGVSCVYPTKDREKGPSLQNISSRLEQLEHLLSRFVDHGPSITEYAADCEDRRGDSSAELRSQDRAQHGADINATAAASQHTSGQHASRSTWEILLNDGQGVRDVNDSNIESLIRDEERTRVAQPTGPETTPFDTHKSTNAHHVFDKPGSGACLDMVSDVLEYHPDTQLALQLWTIYVKSVDPVLKILHIPTVQSTVIQTIMNPRSACSSTVALMFAIYFAAITALCHDNNDNEPIDLPYEKTALLKRYKAALDRLLLVTDLMNQPEITALQALAIYVTCLRAHEVGRSVWILNGLAINLAQSIGLHLDGTSIQLSPFETEMRLRLWWHLCVLDSRAPEDQGFQPKVDIVNRDLRLPLNVNDNQICPEMTCLPVESDGWTEMSFFLLQTESCRLLHPILDTQGQHSADALLDITEKRKIIEEHGQYVSSKYNMSSYVSDMPTDLPSIAMHHVTNAAKKMRFVLQLREEISMAKQKRTTQDDATPDILKPSFKMACDGLESYYTLTKTSPSFRFKWLFRLYTPWYALAYVLRCLCSNPCGSGTERAWVLVEELFPRGMSLQGNPAGSHDEYGNNSIWKCLNVLRFKALSLRQHAQLPEATADVEVPSFNTSQLLPDTEALSSTRTTATETAHGASTAPELGQDYSVDLDQHIFSSLDLSMSEIPFLPDWNAVINGCIDDDAHSSLL